MSESVPDGWSVKRLGDICSVKGGKRLPKGKTFSLTMTKYPYIRVSDFRNGTVCKEELKYVDENVRDSIKRYTISFKDIYISIAGSIGMIGIVPKVLDGSLLTENAAKIVINKSIISQHFLKFCLNSESSQFQFHQEKGTGGGVPKLALFRIEENTIPIPPLPEQQKIASILTSVDTVIEKIEAQINKLKDLKKAMMQELLTKGIGHTEFKDSPVGRIPVGWEVKSIENILNSIIDFRGRTPKKLDMDWGGGNIPALSANNVQMGKINFAKECYLASNKLYEVWMTKGDAEKDDIVLTMEAPLGNVALIPDSRKYILSQRVILLKTKNIENTFLFHYLASEEFQRSLYLNSTGTTALGIQQKRLIKLHLSIPPLPEQQKIASILTSVENNIDEKQNTLHHTKSLKKALMQDLLTGKVRVAV